MVERVSPESLRTAKFGDHTYQRRVITGPDSIEHIAAYIEALEAWKAEAMEALRTFAEDGELFGHPDKYQIAARRLVEKEDGR